MPQNDVTLEPRANRTYKNRAKSRHSKNNKGTNPFELDDVLSSLPNDLKDKLMNLKKGAPKRMLLSFYIRFKNKQFLTPTQLFP